VRHGISLDAQGCTRWILPLPAKGPEGPLLFVR
jgi:hypothetical protein